MDYPYKLGAYVRKVTTTSADAQRWFNRGLNWCFGYHHEEAVACFEKALAADPNCAMAHWGVAYATGPNYNFPWDPAGKAASLARCHDATRAAVALAGGISVPERACVSASKIGSDSCVDGPLGSRALARILTADRLRSCVRPVDAARCPLAQMGSATRSRTMLRPRGP
jgi:hypothetical protein